MNWIMNIFRRLFPRDEERIEPFEEWLRTATIEELNKEIDGYVDFLNDPDPSCGGSVTEQYVKESLLSRLPILDAELKGRGTR